MSGVAPEAVAELEEVEVLVGRVVRDLSTALSRNRDIDEVGLIPSPEARFNRSPVVLVQNKLGVESWCVKLLLPHVHNKLLRYRQRRLWLDRDALVEITETLLLLNPDFSTAWNVRKELVQAGALNPERDLHLAKLALSKSPKSPETWSHRRWVLLHVLQNQNQSNQHLSEPLARTLRQELDLCATAAGRYPSNYNAWSHRIWALQSLAKGDPKVLLDELLSVRSWVSAHVSDHSGFHYRQFLLQQLAAAPASAVDTPGSASLDSPEACPGPDSVSHQGPDNPPEQDLVQERLWTPSSVLQLLVQEMALVSDLIRTFPGHEALWSHRRHVFSLWQRWSGRCSRQVCAGSEPMEVDRPSSSELADIKHLRYEDHGLQEHKGHCPLSPRGSVPSLQGERMFLSGVLDSECGPQQKNLALAYKKWMDLVLGAQCLR